jgi:hypothetical protein
MSGSLSAHQEHHMSDFSDQPFSAVDARMGGPNRFNLGTAGIMYHPHDDPHDFVLAPVDRENRQRLQQQHVVAIDAAASTSANQANQINASAENGPFADPANVHKIFIVRRTFEPSLSDELVIFVR